jgi:hypothetical protein
MKLFHSLSNPVNAAPVPLGGFTQAQPVKHIGGYKFLLCPRKPPSIAQVIQTFVVFESICDRIYQPPRMPFTKSRDRRDLTAGRTAVKIKSHHRKPATAKHALRPQTDKFRIIAKINAAITALLTACPFIELKHKNPPVVR